jgi:hypothetical protein
MNVAGSWERLEYRLRLDAVDLVWRGATRS